MTALRPEFWAGKKVLLTGQTGFKGAWLSLWLKQLGAEVSALALPPHTTPSLYALCQLEHLIDSRHGDICQPEPLAALLREVQPEIVIHAAAQALVRQSYRDPQQTFMTNIMGTVHLFEAVRHVNSVRVLLNITTDKCYDQSSGRQAFQEDSPLGGHDPYSASKACSEIITASYRSAFFPPERLAQHRLAIATARAGNVIGGGDWSQDRLIPDILRAFSSQQPVCLRYPAAIRPWQFVLDPLHGYLRLIEALWTDGVAFSGAWNFGPDPEKSQTVGWIAHYLQAGWPGARVVHETAPQPHEAPFLSLDSSRAAQRLNWQPQLSLAETLDWIVAWHQAHAAGQNMRAVTMAQIEEFQARIS